MKRSLLMLAVCIAMVCGCSTNPTPEQIIVKVLKEANEMEVQVKKDNHDVLVNIVRYGKTTNMFHAAGIVAAVIGKLQEGGSIGKDGILAVYFPEPNTPGVRTNLSTVARFNQLVKTNDEWGIQQMNLRMWEIIFSKTKPNFL